MRKKYFTLEAWRAAERERQKKWREKNRGYERVRAKNNYQESGRGSDEGGHQGAVEGDGGAQGGLGAADSGVGKGVLGAPWANVGDSARGAKSRDKVKSLGLGEVTYGPVEGVDEGYEARGYRPPGVAGSMEPAKRVVEVEHPLPEELGEQLEVMKARQRVRQELENLEIEI